MTPRQLREKNSKEQKLLKIRQDYRVQLIEARRKYGDWIPFGYNIDLFKVVNQNEL